MPELYRVQVAPSGENEGGEKKAAVMSSEPIQNHMEVKSLRNREGDEEVEKLNWMESKYFTVSYREKQYKASAVLTMHLRNKPIALAKYQ